MMRVIQYDESAQIVQGGLGHNDLPVQVDPALNAAAEKLLKRYHEIVTILLEAPDEQESGRPSYSNHLAEDASDASEWQSRAAMTHHLADELQQVEHALAIMERGRYGQCEQCGRTIPPRRMAIIPSSTLCVPCQERADQLGMGH